MPAVALADDGAPTITVPDGEPPDRLRVAPLVRGDGAQVRPGQDVTIQYTGMAWETGAPYDSTWATGKVPQTVAIDETFPGLRDGLVDQTVGSQVLLVIPPAQAQGTDTLVLVVDILAVAGGDEDALVSPTPAPSAEQPAEQPSGEQPSGSSRRPGQPVATTTSAAARASRSSSSACSCAAHPSHRCAQVPPSRSSARRCRTGSGASSQTRTSTEGASTAEPAPHPSTTSTSGTGVPGGGTARTPSTRPACQS